MSDVEDLLTRTLRDPDRALPAPADALPAIRARVRRQRRTTALAAAAVVLVATAALVVPTAVTRLTRPVPVATDPPTASSGLLPWGARGPLAGDAELLGDAAEVWQDAGGPTEVRLLWAGPVTGGRAVLLQGVGGDGRGAIAEVGDRAGRLALLRTEPIWEPGVQLARLVVPDTGAERTLLLPRPGAVTLRLLTGTPVDEPVPAGGLVTLDGDQEGQPVALLDRDGRVLGDDPVAPTGSLLARRQDVRLTTPLWERSYGVRLPEAGDYTGGQVLSQELPTSPLRAPVSVGVIDGSTTLDIRPAGTARPVFYELHQSGRTYLGWIVWVGDQPECLHLDDVTDRTQADALVLRCVLPRTGEALVHVLLHEGIRMARLRLDAAGPGQRAVDRRYASPVEGGEVSLVGSGFPTGPGQVDLVDDGRQARPPLRLPAYRA